MKMFFMALCCWAAAFGLARADEPVLAVTVPPAVHTILGGVVKSVSWAKPAKETRSEIVVIDAAKKKVDILITSTTTLWDADAKAIMRDEITPKRRVNVFYTTTDEGINVAKSLKLLK